jgi:tetratricopeptide (TPR) repeat protein
MLSSTRILFAMLAAGLLLTHAPGVRAATDCDMLAAHPADPDAATPGLVRADIDLEAAERACRAAVAAHPGDARQHYQLSRVLYYSGGSLDEVMTHLRVAAEHSYRQAQFVLGYLYATDPRLGEDLCRAAGLWQRAAGHGHPWSNYHLVERTLDGSLQACGLARDAVAVREWMQQATSLIDAEASRGRVEALYRRYLESIGSPGLVNPGEPPTRCDALAAHGYDAGRRAPGLGRAQIDLDAAIEACREAVAEAPDEARLRYQLARVLYYAGRVDEAMPELSHSSDLGWAQGTFVLGYVYSGDDQVFPAQPCRAAGLYRASLDQDHFWSKVFLAQQWVDGELAGCQIRLTPGEVLGMLRSARVQAEIDPSFADGAAQVAALLEAMTAADDD